MTQHHPARTARPSHKKSTQPPLWRALLSLGLIAIVLQYGLTLMPKGTAAGKLGQWAASQALYFWLVGGVFIALGALTLLVRGKGSRDDAANGEVHSADGAAQVAVATELKLPVELVQVHVRRAIRPRVHHDPKPRLRRPARRVTIHLPAGRIMEDPGPSLGVRLSPLLGQLRRHTWRPDKGRCVLVAGVPDPKDGEDVPEAATDPRERAEQVLTPVVGQKHPLHAEVARRDNTGAPAEINVRHAPNLKLGTDQALALQQRVDERMPAQGGRGWGVEIQPEHDTIRVYQRPAMPDFIPHPVIDDYDGYFASQERCGADPELYGPEPRVLPCATDEFNRVCGWNISRKTDKPHALLIGPTGGGKTNAITTMVVGAARQGSVNSDIAIWGLDPKMIELMGLNGFPGVSQLAFRIEAMAATIDAAYDEMMHRYNLIADYKIHPEDLPPLVLILDEYLILVSMLTYWWKNEKGGKGQCKQINKITQMLALSRSSAIYILLGVQRPDATLFTEGARDNLRFRGSLGQLSPEGARMVWNNEGIGVRPINTKGRGIITGPDGMPIEAQYWYTPAIDPHPMYRDRLNADDRTLVDALSPPMYSPRSLTLDNVDLPPSGEAPKMGGLEAEMMDVQDVVRARELDTGDAVKMEDSSGRMHRAYIDVADYDEQSRTVSLTIHWEGGSAEDMDLSGDEEVWYLGNG